MCGARSRTRLHSDLSSSAQALQQSFLRVEQCQRDLFGGMMAPAACPVGRPPSTETCSDSVTASCVVSASSNIFVQPRAVR
jgi:hypothetical protein